MEPRRDRRRRRRRRGARRSAAAGGGSSSPSSSCSRSSSLAVLDDGRARREGRGAQGADQGQQLPAGDRRRPGPPARSTGSSPRPARSPRAATCRSASPAKAARSCACSSSPASGSRAGQVLAVIDRSVQSQQAAQLAAQIEVARADLRLAQNQLDRAQSLVGRGFISQADLDQKRATRDAAAARVRVAEAPARRRPAPRSAGSTCARPTAGLVLSRSGRGRPGRRRRLAAPCSASPRAARWSCWRSCRRTISPASRSARPATVTPVGSTQTLPGHGLAGLADHRSADPPGHRPRRACPIIATLRPGGFAQAHDPTPAPTTRRCCPKSAVQSDDQRQFRLRRRRATTRSSAAPVTIGEVNDRGVAIVSAASPATSASCCRPAPSSTRASKVRPERAAPRRAEGSRRMNFRNISAWSIRNPVPAARPVRRADAGRHRQLHADGRRTTIRTSISRSSRSASRSRAPRRPSSRPRSRSRSRPRSAASTASTRSTRRVSEGNSQHLRPARDRHADRPRGQRRARRRSPRSAATCPTAFSSRRSAARHVASDDRSPISRSMLDRHDARAAELVCRQYRLAGACSSVPRHGRGRPQRRRQPRDPRHPRSGPAAVARHHRGPGQRAAARRPTSTPPAAAPRSPAPSSRCACSATPATPIELGQTADRGRRRPHGQARRHRRRARPLCRAAQLSRR